MSLLLFYFAVRNSQNDESIIIKSELFTFSVDFLAT